MRHLVPIAIALAVTACGGVRETTPAAEGTTSAAPPSTSGADADAPGSAASETAPEAGSGEANEFVINDSSGASSAQSAKPSKIKPTATAAALKFFVIDKDKGPIKGIVISLTAPDGKKYYTEETDADGYAELLVPIGQKYDIVYLSLGRRDVAAKVTVTDQPRQNLRLTMRYQRIDPPPGEQERFVLDDIYFDSGKTVLRPQSFPRLESIVEYMTHKKTARIEISGHTDNVGKPKTNKALSLKRAQACRDYLIAKGIDAGRIVAVGYGDERPIAPNDTEDGRQKNRRIEATEQ
jgi:outer membrane protein OmpA-like peptidoglycan-associated protein